MSKEKKFSRFHHRARKVPIPKPPWPRIWPENGIFRATYQLPSIRLTDTEKQFIQAAAQISDVSMTQWARIVLCNEALMTVKSGVDKWSKENRVKYDYRLLDNSDTNLFGRKPLPPDIPEDTE